MATVAPPQLSFQYILYVNPDKEQQIINLVHPNAKIIVQSVHKLPRPLPDFLTGTPILAEPNRSRLWRGVREVTEQLANYNEFLYFHIPEWYRATATPLLQRFPVSADNLPVPMPPVVPIPTLMPASSPPQYGFPNPVPVAPLTPPNPTPATPPPITAAPVLANSAAPVMAVAPVDVSGAPNETLPPIIPPINGYRIKGGTADTTGPQLTPPPAAAVNPAPPPQPAFPPIMSTATAPAPARRFQYGSGTNRNPAAPPTTT